MDTNAESRAPTKGETLVVGAAGRFFSTDRPKVEVVLCGGTELEFERRIRLRHWLRWLGGGKTTEHLARLECSNLRPTEPADVLYVGDQDILVNRLAPGQRVIVLQLPKEAEGIIVDSKSKQKGIDFSSPATIRPGIRRIEW